MSFHLSLSITWDGGHRVCRAQAAIEQKRRFNLASDYEEVSLNGASYEDIYRSYSPLNDCLSYE